MPHHRISLGHYFGTEQRSVVQLLWEALASFTFRRLLASLSKSQLVGKRADRIHLWAMGLSEWFGFIHTGVCLRLLLDFRHVRGDRDCQPYAVERHDNSRQGRVMGEDAVRGSDG